MKRIKRNELIIILTILEVLVLILLFNTYMNKNKYHITNEVRFKEQQIDYSTFALLVEQNGNYVESDDNTWPTLPNYKFDSTLSYCMDLNNEAVDNVLEFNNGMMTLAANKSVKCYVYFTKPYFISINGETLPYVQDELVDLSELAQNKTVSITNNVDGATLSPNVNQVTFIISGFTATDLSNNAVYGTTTNPTNSWNGSLVNARYFKNLGDKGETVTINVSTNNSLPTVTKIGNECGYTIRSDGTSIEYQSGVSVIPNSNNLYVYCISPDISLSSNDYQNYRSKQPTLTGCTGVSWDAQYQRFIYSSSASIPSNCTVTFSEYSNAPLLSSKIVAGTYTNYSIVEETDSNGKDAGLRFQGQSPNNYVWFNNEMWRIIGLVPACLTENCGVNGTRLVKIIRNDSIGALAYDAKSSGYTGEWGSNTLYTLLNSYYYGASDGTNSEGCYHYQNTVAANCNYTSIGIKPTGYYGSMIQNVYWYKGSTDNDEDVNYAYNISNERASTITTAVPIGLMNASELGYASLNNSETSMFRVAIAKNNWLFKDGYEWTSTEETRDGRAIHIHYFGYMYYYNTLEGYSVRPALYLKTSVKAIAGTGEINNPYILGF